MKINYKLYQVQRDKTREFGFMGLSVMQAMKVELNGNNYVKTYEGEIEAENVNHALNDLFHKFNMEHPEDFTHYSMSVGDIIVIDGKNHFVDSFGFAEVEINFSEGV